MWAAALFGVLTTSVICSLHKESYSNTRCNTEFHFSEWSSEFPLPMLLMHPGQSPHSPECGTWRCWPAGPQDRGQMSPSLAFTTPMRCSLCKWSWGCKNWGHTNLTVALWLSVKPSCIFFPYRWCPGLTLIIEIHSAAADPDESRICPFFPSCPSVNQFKKKLIWSEKLSFKAEWLWASISEVARDSGYVAFQGKKLKVGVWQYFNRLSSWELT